MTGYTKEKSQKLEQRHDAKADEYERQAREAEQSETFNSSGSKDLHAAARAEREKAEAQRALQKHWGDR